jgi:hypothetical protein
MKELLLWTQIASLLALAVTLFVHILLAVGVNAEAKRLKSAQAPLYAFDGATWTFVVLITGILGFLTFWLVHGSALRDHGLFRR